MLFWFATASLEGGGLMKMTIHKTIFDFGDRHLCKDASLLSGRRMWLKTFPCTRTRFSLLRAIICVLAVAVQATVSQGENLQASSARHEHGYFLYVGTYTDADSKGIYGYRFDAETGRLAPLGVAAEVVNPSFVITDRAHRHLYAVTEMTERGPDPYKTNGYISSFSIDSKTGSLTFLNKVSSGGGGPCHLVVDRSGKILFVANYGSGNVASFAIEPDGRIGVMTGQDQQSGSSIDPKRQQGPHAHAVVLSPDNRFLFVPDLGLDRILIYRVDEAKRSFTPNNPSYVSVKPGLGPRHFLFGAEARFAYAVCEMGSSVVAFSYDDQSGRLGPVQTISTLPPDFSGEDNSAEIQSSPSGHFLYVSNRGNDSIAVFQVDMRTGLLNKVQIVPTQGKIPRNFVIDPTGRYLLVANQNSNNIVVFAINPDSGQLTPTTQVTNVPSPVSILFVSAQK
jgi:6-phosphogluconolactonase